MLDRFGVICMWVRDLPRMEAFYRDTLGLPGSDIHPGEGYQPGVDWVRFELNGPALELFAESRSAQRRAGLPYPRRNSTVLCFIVDDFDAEHRRLSDRGVEFHAIAEEEWGRCAHFRDPEDNELQIYHPRPGY